jgi:hypothetical protein
MNILFYLDVITLTCFDQSWSSSEGSSFNQYNIYTSQRQNIHHTRLTLIFKPKYDKCDGPDMNTIKLKNICSCIAEVDYDILVTVWSFFRHSFKTDLLHAVL